MSSWIPSRLAPVRRRFRQAASLRGLVTGVLLAALGGIGLGILRLLGVGIPPLGPTVGLLLGIPALAALWGFLRRPDWQSVAAAVDRRYGLKDRTVSAVEFDGRVDSSPLLVLQLDDAERHLHDLAPREVAPLHLPRHWPVAAAASLLALALWLWPVAVQRAQARPLTPRPELVAVADRVEEDLDALRKLAREQHEPELEKALQELAPKAAALREPGVDVKEALATLSELQAVLKAQQARFNTGLVDAQLKSLGEALSASQAFEAAAGALQEGRHDRAAEALDAAKPEAMDRKEARAVREALQKSAAAMAAAGLGQLSEATRKLAESLDKDAKECQGQCQGLAKLVRAQARRKQLGDLLSLQCDQLSECKGACQSSKNSLTRGKKPEVSTQPSSNFGLGTSGELYGEKRELGSRRERQSLQGDPGEGPSDFETSLAPEARQQASRRYREAYARYQKAAEAVLGGEAIPLGHRQNIRRYFELIRPQEGEDAITDDDPQPSATP